MVLPRVLALERLNSAIRVVEMRLDVTEILPGDADHESVLGRCWPHGMLLPVPDDGHLTSLLDELLQQLDIDPFCLIVVPTCRTCALEVSVGSPVTLLGNLTLVDAVHNP